MQTEKRISLCLNSTYYAKLKALNKAVNNGVLCDGTYLKSIAYMSIDNEIKKHKELLNSNGVYAVQSDLFSGREKEDSQGRKTRKHNK